MEIKIGELYKNRVLGYLAPCFKDYGKTFVRRYTTVFTLAVGVYDFLMAGCDAVEGKSCFYLLVDRKWQPSQFNTFREWIKLQDYYIADYAFDDISDGRKHMFVIECLPQHLETFKDFQAGHYLAMYGGNPESYEVGRFEMDVMMANEFDVKPVKEEETFNSEYDEE